MTEREKALEPQVAEWERCYDRAQRLRAATEAQVAGLRKALEHYAEQLCEYSSSYRCGKLTREECSGCLARAALANCPAPADAQGVEPVELIERLLNRAANARRDGTATALGDALHFEEAARALRAANGEIAWLREHGADAQGVEPVRYEVRYLNPDSGCGGEWYESTAVAYENHIRAPHPYYEIRALYTALPPDQARREALEERGDD